MKVYKLIVGVLHSNCYVVETKEKNAVIIDAGAEADRILNFCEEKGLNIKKILLTHGHFDHMCAVAPIVLKTGASVYIHHSDAAKLQSEEKSLSNVIPGVVFYKVSKYNTASENEIISQDEVSFKVLHTPGHTKGSVCYITEDIIFSGDTIFCGNVGRTDFPDGSLEEMKKSVNRIKNLEGNYTIYCGHENSTTLENERKTNFYMRDENEDFPV